MEIIDTFQVLLMKLKIIADNKEHFPNIIILEIFKKKVNKTSIFVKIMLLFQKEL